MPLILTDDQPRGLAYNEQIDSKDRVKNVHPAADSSHEETDQGDVHHFDRRRYDAPQSFRRVRGPVGNHRRL